MTAPEKITALGEATGFKADYHQLCLFYSPNHYTVVLLVIFLTFPTPFDKKIRYG
jgi:hypothetical protein